MWGEVHHLIVSCGLDSALTVLYVIEVFVAFILQIFLLADVMYSFLVHKYDLKNGLPRLTKDGKPMALRLA